MFVCFADEQTFHSSIKSKGDQVSWISTSLPAVIKRRHLDPSVSESTRCSRLSVGDVTQAERLENPQVQKLSFIHVWLWRSGEGLTSSYCPHTTVWTFSWLLTLQALTEGLKTTYENIMNYRGSNKTVKKFQHILIWIQNSRLSWKHI